MLNKIEKIEKKGRIAKGKFQLLRYLYGGHLTPVNAILAKCYECAGYYIDGREDCCCENCPLYLYMPYRQQDVANREKLARKSHERAGQLKIRLEG